MPVKLLMKRKQCELENGIDSFNFQLIDESSMNGKYVSLKYFCNH